MRKRAIVLIGFLAASDLIAVSKPSLAAPICWIDHVAKAVGGVEVYFIQKAILRVNVLEKSAGVSAAYTVSNGVLDDGGGHTRDHLFVRDGDEFYASQLVDDSCSYEVSSNETVGELTAKSATHLPGLEPLYTTQIIRTDGTVSGTNTPR